MALSTRRISRDAIRRTRMTTRRDAGARTAVSHYTVLERIHSRFGAFRLFRCESNRTHASDSRSYGFDRHPVAGDTPVRSANKYHYWRAAQKVRSRTGKALRWTAISPCCGTGVRASRTGKQLAFDG